PDGRSLTTLTLDGPTTLGSIDYLSPEQALDFHRVDIRSDIYSLGCVFFFLLTGKPPFGSGPLALKLMRHQQSDPPDLKERRPDAPTALEPIIRRMMAKRPEDRFQQPAEVAEALTPFAVSGGVVSGESEKPGTTHHSPPTTHHPRRLIWLGLGSG